MDPAACKFIYFVFLTVAITIFHNLKDSLVCATRVVIQMEGEIARRNWFCYCHEATWPFASFGWPWFKWFISFIHEEICWYLMRSFPCVFLYFSFLIVLGSFCVSLSSQPPSPLFRVQTDRALKKSTHHSPDWLLGICDQPTAINGVHACMYTDRSPATHGHWARIETTQLFMMMMATEGRALDPLFSCNKR